jgi:hypothetical protein
MPRLVLVLVVLVVLVKGVSEMKTEAELREKDMPVEKRSWRALLPVRRNASKRPLVPSRGVSVHR